MWNFRRRYNHAFFSLVIQIHINSSNFCPTHVIKSITTNELKPSRSSLFMGHLNSCFSTKFSFLSCSTSRNPSTHMVESEHGDGEDFGGSGIDIEQLDVKDDNLIRDVEKILHILRDFRRASIETKQKLQLCGINVSSELVIRVLSCIQNDWAAAFTFFLWAGKQPGYTHSVREYHAMISILGKMRKFDTAWALIDEMRGGRTGPSLVTTKTLLIMIRRYSAVHDVAKAISTFYALKRFKFNIQMEEFQDLLCALCRYKNVKDAEHLLFCNDNVFPFNTKSFNIILNGWCNIMVNLREAKRFWREMDRRGITRDAISYSSMISCYSKTRNLHDVLKLFNQMKELGVAPDRKVYNSVIYGLAKGKLVKEIHELMKTMEKEGFIPNVVTYNSLIKPLCQARQIDEARKFLDEMLQHGLFPSIRTYHAFLRILRTEVDVFELLGKMKETGCYPTYDTYKMLIRKFCRWRQLENAFKVWNEMAENGLSPDRSSYIVLIHGLFLNGKLEEAFKYYEEMKEKGFLPEPKTDEMLQIWASGRQTTRWQMFGLKDNLIYCNSSSNAKITANTGYERDFCRQPEMRKVTREKGFSFWE
ncbi:PREDICTED: pentatricopeptide repeat-containing protein At5g15010, mitochondrial [Nelumbo nucifera]|uniref:Pentatricopeptide repeat-containing protein At5g15010, mitochondrial n=2 Tax=Nelumbo nucifera TaxID=4432 RepID=A0A1U8A777_NELNU|nr:PREDICTED: pentatricopeptide repeat-containing protein At5g15010, mitochondrial [Nelumbo nucifera]XP_010257745.1 PREDICTED: pentatricopeptide repeat-containing protein At5g15010, mitochondrial [Nelumbo nucifera]DAD42012.1 TPA_asm: hypothetical protein HUJ06_000242 [Nelumbo nucifera]